MVALGDASRRKFAGEVVVLGTAGHRALEELNVPPEWYRTPFLSRPRLSQRALRLATLALCACCSRARSASARVATS